MRPRLGVVAGPSAQDPTQLVVAYDDGTIEEFALPQLAPHVRTEIPGAIALATRAERLPDNWDLSSAEGVARALSYLYADIPPDHEHAAGLAHGLAAIQCTVHLGAAPKPALRMSGLLGLEKDLEHLLARLELGKRVTVLNPSKDLRLDAAGVEQRRVPLPRRRRRARVNLRSGKSGVNQV